jgi:hypothetical protein
LRPDRRGESCRRLRRQTAKEALARKWRSRGRFYCCVYCFGGATFFLIGTRIRTKAYHRSSRSQLESFIIIGVEYAGRPMHLLTLGVRGMTAARGTARSDSFPNSKKEPHYYHKISASQTLGTHRSLPLAKSALFATVFSPSSRRRRNYGQISHSPGP